MHEYVHTTLDVNRNTTFSSFSTLPKHLDDLEFVTYEHDGIVHLIRRYTDIGNEYRCRGSCVCLQDENRRFATTTKTLVKGLVYLLVAANSALSFSISKRYFDDICQSTFSSEEVCQDEGSQVTSMVEDCDKLASLSSQPSPTEARKTRNFWCKGGCRSILETPKEEYQGVQIKKIEEMLQFYDCTKMVVQNPMRKFDCGTKLDLDSCTELAESRFRSNHLVHFCRSGSLRSFMVNFATRSEVVKMGVCVEDKIGSDSLKCVEE